jgi:predicted dehydrogenase
MANDSLTRRSLLRMGVGAVGAGAIGRGMLLEPVAMWGQGRMVAPSDTVRFAAIGTGIRGLELLRASLFVPGIECVGACDLYDGRHQAACEAVQKDIPTTRNYKEILDRKDVDAVIVAVTDHQHRRVVVDACAAGKDVYCEKPMSHTVEDGFAMIDAAHKGSRILQIGSQRVSSVLYAKAKEIYDSGKLGEVCYIEAYWDRNSSGGSWQYPIPSDASEKTIDWSAFLVDAPQRPFDAARFFRWRCFRDYGEGLGGDLFVHLISGIQFITSTNVVPSRAQSTGGLFRWKDGRDFPDLLETLYDYPNFRVAIRCNQNNDGGEFIGFYGTKGTMIIRNSNLTYKPQDTREQAQTYAAMGFSVAMRNEYLAQWKAQHPDEPALGYKVDEQGEEFSTPPHYSDVADHEANFFQAVRTRKPTVENEVFGNNAALSCHLANYAYFNKTIATWDAAGKKITG